MFNCITSATFFVRRKLQSETQKVRLRKFFRQLKIIAKSSHFAAKWAQSTESQLRLCEATTSTPNEPLDSHKNAKNPRHQRLFKSFTPSVPPAKKKPKKPPW
jgi:hypothetical protein